MSCYHFYVMMMSMAVSVHASVTDWILTDGLINLSSTNKDQPFEFHNRRTFPIFLSLSKLIFRNILHPNAPQAKGYIFFSFLGRSTKIREISPPNQVVSEKLDAHSFSAHLTSRDEQTNNLALDLSKLYWQDLSKVLRGFVRMGKISSQPNCLREA